MNPEFKSKWVTALRSGDYKQGRSKLRDEDDRFCCLGVAADLLVKEGQGEWSMLQGDRYRFTHPIYDKFNYGSSLLDEGRDLIGIREAEEMTLARKNDQGDSFESIANYIEANL